MIKTGEHGLCNLHFLYLKFIFVRYFPEKLKPALGDILGSST